MAESAVTTKSKSKKKAKTISEPLWYKDAIFYQLHVRAFFDANSDGVGDFRGLAQKLDYLYDLGVTTLWVLPFYPSPLRDEGYDIADYTNIHPLYGDLADFKYLLKEAHKRGLRVVTELVLNHTSDQHPWFQRARRAPAGSSHRDFYVWSDSPEKYKDARIIFKDFESSNWCWDPVAKAYYWHRFYSHQPDLNYDNPEVRKAAKSILDFWFSLGVDGLRLDAVPYIFEREGTTCENLPETHQFLKQLRSYVDKKHPGRMLLAEANQWPEDAVAYFGNGDECHMAFHFPIMPRMFMAIRMEDSFPIVDIMEQTPEIPETAQWAIFLRNHDELTLEMVTDEERDYMYRVYAGDPQARLNLGIRRRLAPLIGNNRRKIELMNGLLFSLPGTPILYYGDEIGMGDNIYLGDRNGVRTPMQWTGDRNAGFSKANPQKLYSPVIIDPEYHYETLNVEAQQNNLHSLLWWTKRMIALRKQYRAFGRGSITFLNADNPKILAFIREFENEKIFVVANLSRFVQYAELDLSKYKGMFPYELFAKTKFPAIGELPYLVMLGPHSFYWFSLEEEPQEGGSESRPAASFAQLEVRGDWETILKKEKRYLFEKILPDYLKTCRWFAGKERRIKEVRIAETIQLPYQKMNAYLLFIDTGYSEGESEQYMLPVIYCPVTDFAEISKFPSKMVITGLRVLKAGETGLGFLCDAVFDERFAHALFDFIVQKKKLEGNFGKVEAMALAKLRKWQPKNVPLPQAKLLSAEQSNSSIVFGDKMTLKLYRRLQEGKNPDLELNLFLSETAQFSHITTVGGYIQYRKDHKHVTTLGMLQEWVVSQSDAWRYTLDQLALFNERVLAQADQAKPWPVEANGLVGLSEQSFPDEIKKILGEYLSTVELLAKRTGELHLALAGDGAGSDFDPEPLSYSDMRSLYQSMRNQVGRVFSILKKHKRDAAKELRDRIEAILPLEAKILATAEPLMRTKMKAKKIRCHGDYHLGQALYTGKDFVILDFEGEPLKSVEERRLKRSPIRDVAGMIRSFHYAAYTALWDEEARGALRPEDTARLDEWALFWYRHVSAAFLKTYRETVSVKDLLPKSSEDLQLLLDVYLTEKALYEIGYELKHRPGWIQLPIQGMFELLGDS